MDGKRDRNNWGTERGKGGKREERVGERKCDTEKGRGREEESGGSNEARRRKTGAVWGRLWV